MKTLIKSGLILTLFFAFTLITHAQDITADLKKIEGFIAIAEAPGIEQETLSPNGKYASYVVITFDLKNNAGRRDIYLASSDGQAVRKIEIPSNAIPSSLKWFPEGNSFAFLLRINGKSQLYLGEAETGKIRQISQDEGSVDEYAIHKNGKIAILTSNASGKQIWVQSKGNNDAFVLLKESLFRPNSLRWHPDGQQIYFIQNESTAPGLTKNTANVVRWQDEPQLSRQIVSLDIKTKQESRRISDKDFSVINFEISPDGKTLTFQAQSTERSVIPDDLDKTTLRIFNIENGTTRVLVPKLGGPGQSAYAYSPDGKKLAFIAPDRYEYLRNKKLRILDLSKGEVKIQMEKVDLNIRNIFWNESSNGLFFTSPVGVDQYWFSFNLSDGNYSKLCNVPGNYHGRYVNSARAFIFMYSDFYHPYEVFFATPINLADPSHWVQLSKVNSKLASFPTTTVEVIKWKSEDGREIEGVIYKPVGYTQGRSYPMITQVNGGRNSYPGWYQNYAYVLAANGYLVFQPNYRGMGTSGYGEEFVFEGIFPNDPLEVRVNDILTGVEYLIDNGLADRDRLGLMGWSVGGGTSDWLMTKTNMFKAISSGAGGGDMMATYAQIQQYRYYFNKTWGGSAFRSMDYWIDHSALKYIGNATSPTLINVGERDEGVIGQCLTTYNALREFGIPVEMLVHVGQAHQLQSPQSILAKMLAEFYWFEQWIMGGESWLQWQDHFNTIVNGK